MPVILKLVVNNLR